MGSFAYEWVTKVLGEGNDWRLVRKGPNVSSWWRKVQFEATDRGQAGELNLFEYEGEKEQQVTAFSKLLPATYGQPYYLSSCEELIAITSLARFYVALPTLSRSLLGQSFTRRA